jgi:tryptophan-rich sensory protein
MTKNNLLKLVVSVAICEGAGIMGSLFTIPAIGSWYQFLNKPAFSPPNWLFGPAWTTLYLLMGVALFLVWKNKGSKVAFIIFSIQLFLNAIWSIIFFGFHSPFWAFVDLVAMWFVIVGTIFVFYRISKPATYLLLPYIAWVSFAGYLNYSIWQLNPPITVSNLIIVESPRAYEKISSPLVVTGKARGTWYFEASFPVQLFDDNGKELTVVPAQAKTNWMTTDFVDFKAILNFSKPSTQKGYIIFKKDNPSGLPEYDDQIRIPVVF